MHADAHKYLRKGGKIPYKSSLGGIRCKNPSLIWYLSPARSPIWKRETETMLDPKFRRKPKPKTCSMEGTEAVLGSYDRGYWKI